MGHTNRILPFVVRESELLEHRGDDVLNDWFWKICSPPVVSGTTATDDLGKYVVCDDRFPPA
jgi:hypothetical protein